MGREGVRVQASFSGHTPHRARRPVPAVTVFPQNTLISTQMALPGTLSWQLAAPLTHWHPQLEFPRTAGPRPTLLMSSLPRLRLTPYFPSLQAGTDPCFPLLGSATGGTYLPLLGGWTSRTGHKHGAADESWLVLARRSEQWLTQRAPWPRSVPARLSPTSAGGPERTSPGNRRHPAGSRLIAPGPGKPHPAFASLIYVTAIGLFLLWRQYSPARRESPRQPLYTETHVEQKHACLEPVAQGKKWTGM